MPHQTLGDRSFLERRLRGQRKVKRTTEAVDVCAIVDQMTVECLFRRKIVGRAENLFIMSHRQGGLIVITAGNLGESREPQVQNLDRTTLVLQQIARLHVAMHKAGLVSMIQSQRRLATELGGILKAECSVLFHNLMKTASFNVLHHQEVDFLILLDLFINVVSSNDVGMIERRDGLSLAKEPRQIRRVVDLLDGQNFDRTPSSHQCVFREIHGTHSAFAKQFTQPVFAKAKAFVLTPLQLLDLPAGEVAILDHPRTNRRRILHIDSGPLHFPHQRLDAIPLKQVALLKDGQERIGREFCHEVFWDRTDRASGFNGRHSERSP